MDDVRYEFLDRKVFTIHKDQEFELSANTLQELSRFESFQAYSRDKMLRITKEGRVREQIVKLVKEILEERRSQPDGSNTECMAMDLFTEFLSKLDLEDFRKVKIERLIDSSEVEQKKECR